MTITRRIGCLCLLLLLSGSLVAAQNAKHETQLRTVSGTVMDKSENPLPGSVVFLKNLRTNGVSSRFADSDGKYKFTGLDPNVDYEVHAELNDEKSASKTMSSLDNRKEVTLNLKIDKKKN
jgi:Carboxypeptidase regulatory-like domain